MAGGIDWFRWHHGSVTDPKFPLVAKRACARLGDVLALWAHLLEKASAATERGHFGAIDCEAMDCMLDMEDGCTAAVLVAMQARGLIEGDRIAAWEKRQPKRERPEDDTAAERKRNQRARDASAGNQSSPEGATCAHVTPSHATSHQKTPRGEERREEIPSSPSGKKKSRREPAPVPESVSAEVLIAAGFDGETAADFIACKSERKAPLTARAWTDHCREAAKAGWTPLQAAEKVMAKTWLGFEAKYVAGEARPGQLHGAAAPRPGKHTGFASKDYRQGVEADGSLA